MLHFVANLNRSANVTCLRFPKRYSAVTLFYGRNSLSTETCQRNKSTIPFRKQLKDEAKLRKAQGTLLKGHPLPEHISDDWKLTVGIEIHAQLNSDQKLFSGAHTSISDEPNSHTALFDLSMPGSQPILQKAVLLPALRAAIALNCEIQYESRFDRKHYFYQDQPAGYQITQYYAPFAKDGHIVLTAADGIAPEDGVELRVGIKQIQLEQDTAKTIQQPPDDMLLDFNRVGHPLIEIITLPHIHSPQTAAACVRKIQDILESVNAVTTGMEMGGLRADINVSVQRSLSAGDHAYAGIQGLGQRTEIKNLSSFKAVEDAIIAERDRQITVLASGGRVEGETRGWTLGSTETRKLRGKEGEVDYRYMPDPDIAPLFVSQGLIDHLKNTLPMLPDEQMMYLSTTYGISSTDAKTLAALDRGLRLDYLAEVLNLTDQAELDVRELGRTASNWILHELGGLLSKHNVPFVNNPVSTKSLAGILEHLLLGKINGQAAKKLLGLAFAGDDRDITKLIDEHDLTIRDIGEDVYTTLGANLLKRHPEIAQEIQTGRTGKLQWLVGQMMRESQGKMDPRRAAETLKHLLEQ